MKMIRKSCLILLSMLFSLSLYGQEDAEIKKKEFKTGVDIGFKEAWEAVKLGNEYYLQGVGTYDLARDQYLFAGNYNPDNAALNYKLGICYMETDNKYKAIDYMKKAYTIDPEVAEDIHLMLGRAYQLVLEFDKAIEHYNLYGFSLSGEDRAEVSTMLAKRITECKNAKELVRNPLRVILQNLGEEVNSAYDDYNPIFSYGDTSFFFSSRRPVEKAKRNPLDNKYNEDVYRSRYRDGVFETSVRLPEPFNTDANDGIVGVNNKGDRYLLYRGHEDGGTMVYTDYNFKKQRWDKPKDFKSHLSSKQGESSACVSSDGQELYYVSRNKDLTTGGKDILVAYLDEKGKWGKPQNLGEHINSPFDEEGVFITPDGQWLYFASKGHNTMGGFDIFRSHRSEFGEWTEPENIGYPVNTPDDEVFFVTDKDQKYGYYSAVRDGGYGAKDLYRVVYLGAEKDLQFRLQDKYLTNLSADKSGFKTPVTALELDTTIHMEGFVLDTAGGEHNTLMSKMTFDIHGGSEINYLSDTSGYYHMQFPGPGIYMLEIVVPEYMYFGEIIDLSHEEGDYILKRDFYLDKVVVDTRVVIDNIYFETGKAVLREESFEALDQVFSFLDNNPSMRLEISGHTDNTGSLRINQKLSGDRAKSVVKYLVDKGIPEEQLEWVGYADTQPIDDNSTPEGREANRRVEFKVLSK